MPDTDGDGVDDGIEILQATDPLDENDFIISGDVNFDGEVNVADYLLLSQYVLGLKVPGAGELYAADMNRNEILNAGDMVIMMRTILGNL